MKHICTKCQKQFEEESLVSFASDWICSDCKPVYVQCLKEGAPLPVLKVRLKKTKHAYRALGVILIASFFLTIPLLNKWSSMIIPGQGRGLTPLINLVGLGSYIVAAVLFVINKRLAPWVLLVSFIFSFQGVMILYVPFILSLLPTAVKIYALWGINAAFIVMAFVLRPKKEGEQNPDPAG